MSNIPSFHSRVRGEYRATLRDLRGKMKYDSGWRPNMVLNQGPWLMTNNYGVFNYMALGDSDIAVDPAQTGIQGNMLINYSEPYNEGVGGANWSTPPYYCYVQTPYTFAPGQGTGTIREFVFSAAGTLASAQNDACIRVVLDAPIVKTLTDQLTIEHRLYMYPDTTTKTGTIDCSGVSWDYEMSMYNIDGMMYGVSDPAALISYYGVGSIRTSYGIPVNQTLVNGVMPATVFDQPTGDQTVPQNQTFRAITQNVVTNGSPPYRTITLYSGVDDMNTTFNLVKLHHSGYPYADPDGGLCLRLARTSDAAQFTKANTHEISFTYRRYLDRYIP